MISSRRSKLTLAYIYITAKLATKTVQLSLAGRLACKEARSIQQSGPARYHRRFSTAASTQVLGQHFAPAKRNFYKEAVASLPLRCKRLASVLRRWAARCQQRPPAQRPSAHPGAKRIEIGSKARALQSCSLLVTKRTEKAGLCGGRHSGAARDFLAGREKLAARLLRLHRQSRWRDVQVAIATSSVIKKLYTFYHIYARRAFCISLLHGSPDFQQSIWKPRLA